MGYRNAVTKMMKDQASGLPCCLHCKETFIPKVTGRPKKFCSDACRRFWCQDHPELHQKQNTAYYELACQHCGKSFLSYGNVKGKHQWFSDRKQTTIWEYNRPKSSKEHPTMNPVQLMAYPIQNSSIHSIGSNRQDMWSVWLSS